jgi:hypothetical protein
MPSPHHAPAFLGESQGVDISDDSLQALPFADHSPIDIEGEITGGAADVQEICYGAVRHLIKPLH